jgi:GNAT superfamily N-acetyltransferase
MLAELGARTFHDSFAHENDPADMAAYLESTFGLDLQAREIADPARTFLIAEVEGHPVGYALIRRTPLPSCVTEPTAIELGRFYVDAPWKGKGVAPALMEECIAEARGRGARLLWLGVYDRNGRAVRFYTKSGFRDVGSHVFMLGRDRQIDRVMVRNLTTEEERQE